MPDRAPRRSALAGHAANGAARPVVEGMGFYMTERAFPGMIALRGDSTDAAFTAAARKAIGLDLPVAPNTAVSTGDVVALWLGPDEWLVTCRDGAGGRLLGALHEALTGTDAAVLDVSDARSVIRLAGRGAPDVLARGCPLDLHPRSFRPGEVAQSTIAKAGVILHQVDGPDREGGPVYDIYVARSYAEYLWLWLVDAAAEHRR